MNMPYSRAPQCYLPPGRGDIPALTPAKLVLDIATPEGSQAEIDLAFVSIWATHF